MSAEIKYNGETLETLNGGEYVTLHTKGKTMEDDIRFEVEEVSGGDIAINGIVEQYKVNAGATVNAGDFVEFVNKVGSGAFCTYDIGEVSACKLDNSRVFVAYKNTANHCVAVVLTFDNTGVSVGKETLIWDVTSFGVSAAVTSSNKVIVSLGSQTYVQVFLLTVNYNEITLKDHWNYNYNEVYNKTVAIALSEERVMVITNHTRKTGGYPYYIQVFLFSVEKTEISCLDITNFAGCDLVTNLSAAALSDNKVLVVYNYSDPTNPNINCAHALTIVVTGSSISVGTAKSLARHFLYKVKAVSLEENKVLVVSNDNGFTGRAFVLTVSESGTIIAGGECVFSDRAMFVSVVVLSEEKAVVTYQNYGSGYGESIALNIDGNTVIAGGQITYFPAVTSVSDILSFSPTSALVIHNSGGGLYTSLTIDGADIKMEGTGTYVQPATSRLHNVGIAKTSGTEGRMVDVYCVGGESE